ncbi:MAG: zinc ribbon domain-containing protein [Thiotrichaceae bacterium]
MQNVRYSFIPTFETQQMVSKLCSSVARNMMTFAHYRFKQFLKAKGQEYQCDVVEVSEAYTTKTCSYCGKQHNMGSKKVIKLVEAGLQLWRTR